MWKWIVILSVWAVCLPGLAFGDEPRPAGVVAVVSRGTPAGGPVAGDAGPTAAQFGVAALVAVAAWRGSRRMLASI